MNFIEVNDVVKRYEKHVALNHVSLSVPEGCVYGLLGPNGAGKTSLIRILNMITEQDEGTINIGGKPLCIDDIQKIGYLPEERGLYKKMKLADHVLYLAQLKGMKKDDARIELRRWLECFDLLGWENKKIEQLSKGMAQKVQFIATVIHRPKLLIFDEPFSGFDPVNAEKLKAEILKLRDQGATILFSTHNMASVEEVCQEISLIDHAEVVLQGKVAEVRQRYKKNIYNVHIKTNPLLPNDALYSIEKISTNNMGGYDAQIRLCDGVALRDVVTELNTKYELGGFAEILPTMNEIFIDVVTNGKKGGIK